jgi:acyl-CoA thioester hydrolase
MTHYIDIRVRYPEVDAMGYLHHSRFLQYFELGRVELLRSMGRSYADLEGAGVYFVVTRAEVKYRAPARYDDLVSLQTTIKRQTMVRIDHSYRLVRKEFTAVGQVETVLAEGETTIACVDRTGQVIPIPEDLAQPKTGEIK